MPTLISEYLTAAQVCARFGGASRMWLHRRLVNDGFPAPVRFGGRFRYFKLSEIQQWEATKAQTGKITSFSPRFAPSSRDAS
jgi:predicted DNA-binding transcriptional regulator AlpA